MAWLVCAEVYQYDMGGPADMMKKVNHISGLNVRDPI
jgi:hypothetical protein